MICKGRRKVDIRKGRQKGRDIENDRKRGNYCHRTIRRWKYYLYKRPLASHGGLVKGDKMAESQKTAEKEEITSTKPPEGGNSIYTLLKKSVASLLGGGNTIPTKGTLDIPTGKKMLEDSPGKIQVNGL